MCEQEFALNGNIVGAGRFAVAAASAADVGFYSRNIRILQHGFFFAALGDEIVVISHDCVDRYAMGALGFALAAGMAAVELPVCFPVCVQFSQIGLGELGS